MEERLINPEIENIKRLSVVDSIDSLSLFYYNVERELVKTETVNKSMINLKDFLQTLAKKYKESELSLYYTNSDFEILPRNLFLYGHESEYLKNLFPIKSKNEIIFIDRCAEEQLVVIYPVPAEKDILYRSKIPGVHTFHISTAFIKSGLSPKSELTALIISNTLLILEKTKSNLICSAIKPFETKEQLVALLKETYKISVNPKSKISLNGDYENWGLDLNEFSSFLEAGDDITSKIKL